MERRLKEVENNLRRTFSNENTKISEKLDELKKENTEIKGILAGLQKENI